MCSKCFKFFAFILIVGIARGTQAKECYSCEGINCLRASKVNNRATCADPVDNCVTVFEGSTIVARGCYSSLPQEHRSKCDDTSDSQCHKCYKSLCNDRGAISCLQCSSEDNNNCTGGVSSLAASRCPVSTSTISYCFTRKSSYEVERGCLIDTSEQLKCLGDSSCEMCIADGEDTCNREAADDIQSGCKPVAVYSIPILVLSSIVTLLYLY